MFHNLNVKHPRMAMALSLLAALSALLVLLRGAHTVWCWSWGNWTTGPVWFTTPSYLGFVAVWAILVIGVLCIFAPEPTTRLSEEDQDDSYDSRRS